MPLTPRTPLPLPGTYLSRFLDTNGDGSGTKNANGNFSAGAQDFFITPPNNTRFDIHRMIVQIEDVGSFNAGDYGSGITLTNGIELLILENSTVIQSLTNDFPVLTNGNWARFCFDVNITDFGGAPADNYADARWSFVRAGVPIVLINQTLAIRLNDDFSGLTSHTFLVQGISR